MSPTAAILRAAAEGPTPKRSENLSAWIAFECPEWHAVVEMLDDPSAYVAPLLVGLTDEERRAFLILVAEVIDNPQYPQESA